MTTPKYTIERRRRQRGKNGQSLIVAIIVLFLLLFLGGLFIALIANNLRATQRAGNVNSASYYAEAGIRFLDEQIMKSPEGADWRPVPDDAPATDQNIDPDYDWVRPYDPATGEGGYTRVNFGGPTLSRGNGGGRALVRLTYAPNPANPVTKYIRLESIGRAGRFDRSDPTSYGSSQAKGLRRELVAYKAIGITDYLRFVTNKDNKPGPVAFGSPTPTFDRSINPNGDPAASTPDPGGRNVDVDGDGDFDLITREMESVFVGPIRVNAPVTFYGFNLFALDPRRNDVVEIAGQILFNNVRPDAPTAADIAQTPANPNPGRLYVQDVSNPAAGTATLFPSLSPSFTTLNGLVRDAPTGNDPNRIDVAPGNADARNTNLRSVARLAPPVIDAEIGSRGLTRYRALTRNAAPMASAFTTANPIPAAVSGYAGLLGWGSGFYINNRRDVQNESETLFNTRSLRSEWLNPGSSEAWKTDFLYTPPAVTITFLPRYMIVTQSAPRAYLRRPNGARIAESRIVRYTALVGSNTPPNAGFPVTPAVPKLEGYPATRGADGVYTGDYVIYAEGNVRVRGVVGGVDPETGAIFRRNLTVVSNGTVYVDGNLLRDNITPEMAASTPALAGVKGKSSIALLAKDYVTVNTTQFLNIEPTEDLTGSTGGAANTITLGPGGTLPFGLTLGPLNANNVTPTTASWYADPTVEPTPVALDTTKMFVFLRHQSEFVGTGRGAYIDLFVNQSPTPFDFTFGNKGALSAYGGYNAATMDQGPQTLPVPVEQAFLSQAFEVNTSLLFPVNPGPYASAPLTALGLENRFTLLNDPSASGTANYSVARIGVAPLDIRIEGFLYAQEGSFFIIPGPWFNPDPNDSYEQYVSPDIARRHHRAGETAVDPVNPQPVRVNPRFPFHKQPMDIRITFFGSIAENMPAEIGDQGAWLEKWGWVPRFYGSTGLPSAAGYPDQGAVIPTRHGYPGALLFGTGEGIVYEFNADAIAPYRTDPATSQIVPIRPNPYRPSEPLPIAPRLPVAPGLLYFGERPIR